MKFLNFFLVFKPASHKKHSANRTQIGKSCHDHSIFSTDVFETWLEAVSLMHQSRSMTSQSKPRPPPTPGHVGLLWGFITILAALWVPGMWGISAFCRFCPEKCGALVGVSFYSGAGQKTPEIFVYASSNEKWRHIRFKMSFTDRFTKRENGVSIIQDFPVFVNHLFCFSL